MARICQTLANTHSNDGSFKESDWMFKWENDKPQSAEEMEAQLLALTKRDK